MRFGLLAILLFCSLISTAQEKDEDLELQKNQILIQHDDTNKVLKIINIGRKYLSVNYDTALVLFQTAHQISLKLDYTNGEIRAKQRIGNAYYLQNNFLKAESFYQEALEKAIENDFKKLIATGFRAKAALKHERGRFEEGVLLLKKALLIHNETNDSTNIASVLNRISVFYRVSKDIDSALFYNTKAIAASISLNNKTLIGRSYRNLAIIYTIKNELNKAESFFIKALDLQSINSREKELLFTKYQYGILLIKQKKYDLAIDILNTCKERTIKIGILKQLPHIYEKLSLAYSGNRQYKEAYQSAIEFHNLSDRLRYAKENKREIEETRNKIIAQRKKAIMLEKEIKIESAFKKKQYILIFALILALIISAILSRISKKKTIKFIIEKQKTNAAKAIIDEYEKMDNWIARELHDDIGGSIAAIRLNMIRTLDIVKAEAEIANKLNSPSFTMDISKLSKIIADREGELQNLKNVQDNIRDLSHSLVPVSFDGNNFIHLIEDKISKRFSKDINCRIQIFPKDKINNISNDLKFNVYRILQNLAANIIIHSKAKNANLQIIGHEDHLTIIVEDDGVGFNTNKRNEGLGLNLIKQRALLFEGKVEIDSTANKGTTIIIDLPYKII